MIHFSGSAYGQRISGLIPTLNGIIVNITSSLIIKHSGECADRISMIAADTLSGDKKMQLQIINVTLDGYISAYGGKNSGEEPNYMNIGAIIARASGCSVKI